MAVSPEVAALLQQLYGQQYLSTPKTADEWIAANYPGVYRGGEDGNTWYGPEGTLIDGQTANEMLNAANAYAEQMKNGGPGFWLRGGREGFRPLSEYEPMVDIGNNISPDNAARYNQMSPTERAKWTNPDGTLIPSAENPFGIDLWKYGNTFNQNLGIGKNPEEDSFLDKIGPFIPLTIAGAGLLANAGLFGGTQAGLGSALDAEIGAAFGGADLTGASGVLPESYWTAQANAGNSLVDFAKSYNPVPSFNPVSPHEASFRILEQQIPNTPGFVDRAINFFTPSPSSLATSAVTQTLGDGRGDNTAQYQAADNDYSSRNAATANIGMQKQTSVFDALVNMAAKTGSTALIMSALGNKNALSNIPLAMGGQILGSIVGTATGLTGNALTNLLKSAGSGIADAAGSLFKGGDGQSVIASDGSIGARNPNDPYWNMTADAGGTVTDVGGSNYIDQYGLPRNAAGDLVIDIVGSSGTSGNGSQNMANGSGDALNDFLSNLFSGNGTPNTTFSPTINVDTSGIANAIGGQNAAIGQMGGQLFNAINQVSQQTGQSMDQIVRGMQAGDQGIINAIQQQTSGISSGLNQGFDVLGQMVNQGNQNLQNQIGQDLSGLNNTFQSGFGGLTNSIGSLSNYFTQGLNNLGNNFQTGFDYLGSGLNNMGNQFGQGLNNVTSGIDNLGRDFASNIAGLTDTLDAEIGQGFNNLGRDFSQGYNNLGQLITQSNQNLSNNLAGLTDTLDTEIGQGFRDISGNIAGLTDTLDTEIGQGFNSITDYLRQQEQQAAIRQAQMIAHDNENASRTYENITRGFGELGSGLSSGFSGLGDAFGSALDRLGNTQTLGTLGAAALGYKAAKDQIDAFERTQDKYLGVGQPYRDRLSQSYQPGFSMQNEPGYADAMNQSMSSLLRGLSASSGSNPFGNPGGLAEANRYALSTTALPALSNYRSGLLGAGSMGLPTAGQAGLSAAGAAQGPFQQLGAGLGALTAPQNDLASLLKQLKGSGISLNLGSGF